MKSVLFIPINVEKPRLIAEAVRVCPVKNAISPKNSLFYFKFNIYNNDCFLIMNVEFFQMSVFAKACCILHIDFDFAFINKK